MFFDKRSGKADFPSWEKIRAFAGDGTRDLLTFLIYSLWAGIEAKARKEAVWITIR